MTRQEKIIAFTMRIDGASYQQIGDKLGYSKQCVSDTLKRSIKEHDIRMRCVYPAVGQWMNRNRMNGSKIAEKLCYNHSTVYQYLNGCTEPSKFFREALAKLTGISEEILFRRLSDE